MPSLSASAPGKCILFGEHAVVYGRPAIAIPVNQVQAKAMLLAQPGPTHSGVFIDAPDIGLAAPLHQLSSAHPFSRLFSALQDHLKIDHFPAFHLRVSSSIPMAAGLGSGAAISIAMLRAVAEFLGQPLPPAVLSELAYEAEKAYHGTPSGIDNAVIAYAKPVFFVRGQPLQFLRIAAPFTLVIAHSGIQSSTAEVVAAVHSTHEKDRAACEALFDQIAALADQARTVLQNGKIAQLGPLMTENHQILQRLDVSLPELDRLTSTALAAGALGAKLSGAGRGGNILALVPPEQAESVSAALLAQGAVRTIITHLTPTEAG